MMRSIKAMSSKGDEILCTWDDVEVSKDRLSEIEAEFNAKMAAGFFAADLTTNEIVNKFKPDTDFLMIPKMAGGRV